MENGIYENSNAKFFVKNKKVLAKNYGWLLQNNF